MIEEFAYLRAIENKSYHWKLSRIFDTRAIPLSHRIEKSDADNNSTTMSLPAKQKILYEDIDKFDKNDVYLISSRVKSFKDQSIVIKDIAQPYAQASMHVIYIKDFQSV